MDRRHRAVPLTLLLVLLMATPVPSVMAAEPTGPEELSGSPLPAPPSSPETHTQPVTEDDQRITDEAPTSDLATPRHEQAVAGASDEPLPTGDDPGVEAPPPPQRRSADDEDREDALAVDEGETSLQATSIDPDAPVGVPDAYVVANDQVLTVAAPGFLGNDLDPDGEALTATLIVDNVDHGSLVAFADGSFSYTPDAGFTGTDTFVYRMRDASGNTADATVTIEVLPAANRAPLGTPDAYAMRADTTLSVASPGFLGNDLDPDGEALTATLIVDNVDHGSLVAFADGSFSYTPDAGFTGTDTFVYRMRDESGNTADATVTIEVVEGNRAPIGVDDRYALVVDTTLTVASSGFLGNDLDLDGEVLTATLIVDNVDHGSLVAFADGSFTYTPDAGFTGTDTFVYRMRDASGNTADATVTIDVLGAVGTAPVGVPDAYVVANDQVLTVAAPGFLGNDLDPDGEALTATLIVDNVDHGSLVAFADGSFSYTPDAGFTGTDTFVYRMRDASGNTADATVTIEVLPAANRAPLGTPDAYAMRADTTLSVASPGFLGNDLDPDGEALTATLIVDNVDHGSLVAFADGSFSYTPDAGFTGTDTFVYRMRDESGNTADATVTIEVVEGNRAPIGVDDRYALVVDTTLTVASPGFLGNDLDLDGEVLTATLIVDNVDHGSLVAFADGSFTYTPDAGFTGTDTFVYRMRDASGNTADATVTIDVLDLDVNAPPVAVDDTYDAVQDTPLTVDAPGVLANDTDPDGDPLAVDAYDATSTNGATVTMTPDGAFTYTPAAGFAGTDTFTYTITDGRGGTDTATVTIDVNGPPVAVDDTYDAVQDTPLTVDAPGVLANDTDPDGDPLAVDAYDATSTYGATVTMTPDGAFTYTPAAGFAGTDTFTYTITDGRGGTDTATVTIDVNGPPVAVDDTYDAVQDTPLTVDAPGVLANDTDPDGDPLAVDAYDATSTYGATVTMTPDGAFIYTPAAGFAGTDTFTYTITDGRGGTDTATVTIDVGATANRSIDLELLSFDLVEGELAGQLQITNRTSSGAAVQVIDAEVYAEYRVPRIRGWTRVSVTPGSCVLEPALTFLVTDEQVVTFTGCELDQPLPAGATVRVTGRVQIAGVIRGRGHDDGWFTSRLSN
jgi:large repetitive protein